MLGRLSAPATAGAVVMALFAGAARADLQEIKLATDKNEPVRAILAKPAGEGRRPAVIFNHGSAVRVEGYEGARRRNKGDVDSFLKGLVRENYVALAPLREILASEAGYGRHGITGTDEAWTDVVDFGIRAVVAARRYLAERPDVDPQRIAVIGFSEGGNVTLWSAIESEGFRAVVLLAPATLSHTKSRRLFMAAQEDQVRQIKAPVFLAATQNDNPPIIRVSQNNLIPNLQKTNPGFRHRIDYPGSHKTFYDVDDEYWKDVTAFLKQHLN